MSVTNSIFTRTIGRFTLGISVNAVQDPDYLYGGEIEISPQNRGPSDRIERHNVSLEDIRELHYLTGRAIAQAKDAARKALRRRS